MKENECITNLLDKYKEMTHREILIRLGSTELTLDTFGASPPTVSDCLKAAKEFFAKNYITIKSTICCNKDKIITKRNSAAAATIDLMMNHYGQISAVFVALYIIDYGVEKFCTNDKDRFLNSMPL